MTGTDFHQHVWPDGFRRALERRAAPPTLRGRRLVLPTGGAFELDLDRYSAEARLAELDEGGLERAVVSLPPTTEPTPDLVDEWHAGALEIANLTGGRLVPLSYGSSVRGFAGAIVDASALSQIDEHSELFSRLEDEERILFVHPGPTTPEQPAWRTAGLGYAQQMLRAYAAWLAAGSRWPRLRVVFALLAGGAAFQIERLVRRGLAAEAPLTANVWFDTSSYGERAIELTLQTFGASRLVFGSDAPIDALADALASTRRFGSALEVQVLVSTPLDLLVPERVRWAA